MGAKRTRSCRPTLPGDTVRPRTAMPAYRDGTRAMVWWIRGNRVCERCFDELKLARVE